MSSEALYYAYYQNVKHKVMSLKSEYEKLKASGMMWEFHPDYTGEWEVDKVKFINDKDMKDVQINDTFMIPEQEKKVNDVINHPAHYASGKIECIEAIEESTKDLSGIEAVCTGNIIKYVWRWKKKNGIEDLKKCAWYLQRLINKLESEATGND